MKACVLECNLREHSVQFIFYCNMTNANVRSFNNLLVHHSGYDPKHIKCYNELTPKEPFKSTIEWYYTEIGRQLHKLGFKRFTLNYDLATDQIHVILHDQLMHLDVAEYLHERLLDAAGLKVTSVYNKAVETKPWVHIQIENDIYPFGKRGHPLFTLPKK